MDKENLVWCLFVCFLKKEKEQERALGDQVEIVFISQGLLHKLLEKERLVRVSHIFKKRAAVLLFILRIRVLFVISSGQKIP